MAVGTGNRAGRAGLGRVGKAEGLLLPFLSGNVGTRELCHFRVASGRVSAVLCVGVGMSGRGLYVMLLGSGVWGGLSLCPR